MKKILSQNIFLTLLIILCSLSPSFAQVVDRPQPPTTQVHQRAQAPAWTTETQRPTVQTQQNTSSYSSYSTSSTHTSTRSGRIYHHFGDNPVIPGGLTPEQARQRGWEVYQLPEDALGAMWGAAGERTSEKYFAAGTWVAYDGKCVRALACGNPTTLQHIIFRTRIEIQQKEVVRYVEVEKPYVIYAIQQNPQPIVPLAGPVIQEYTIVTPVQLNLDLGGQPQNVINNTVAGGTGGNAMGGAGGIGNGGNARNGSVSNNNGNYNANDLLNLSSNSNHVQGTNTQTQGQQSNNTNQSQSNSANTTGVNTGAGGTVLGGSSSTGIQR